MKKPSINLLMKEMRSGKTILGVGPISKMVCDVVNKISSDYKIPILLIASRRQIESRYLGNSYVMSTEDLFYKYRCNVINQYLYLCRDHGGPWQGINEDNILESVAMKNALNSYDCDMICLFDILHIDPSKKLIKDEYN